jgi:hypothetical protein
VTLQAGVIPVRRDPYVCHHRRENGPIFGRERVRLSSQTSTCRAGITCEVQLGISAVGDLFRRHPPPKPSSFQGSSRASTVSGGPRLLGARSARAIFR